MRGYHANSHYYSHFGAGDFLFTYLLISAMTPRFGYYYSTPPSRVPDMRRERTSYRQSSAYTRQAPAQQHLQVEVCGFTLPAGAEQREFQPPHVSVHAEEQRRVQEQQHYLAFHVQGIILWVVEQVRRVRGRGRDEGQGSKVRLTPVTRPFRFSARLSGMADEDGLCLVLPPEFSRGSGLPTNLERVFPSDEERAEGSRVVVRPPDKPGLVGDIRGVPGRGGGVASSGDVTCWCRRGMDRALT